MEWPDKGFRAGVQRVLEDCEKEEESLFSETLQNDLETTQELLDVGRYG